MLFLSVFVKGGKIILYPIMARIVGANHYMLLGNKGGDDDNTGENMEELGVDVGLSKPKKTVTHRRHTRRLTKEEKEKMKHKEVFLLYKKTRPH